MADTKTKSTPEPAPGPNRAERRLVTVRYAANYCGVTTYAVRRWIHSGTLPAFRVGPTGKDYRIDLADVHALVVPVVPA